MKKLVVLSLFVASIFALVMAQDTTEATQADGTMMDVIATDSNFSTLYSAIQAAGLEATLSSEGPFTLFAPTNDAFAALPADEVDALFADPTALSELLLGHVIMVNYAASDVMGLTSLSTAQGTELSVALDAENNVMVGDAKVIEADILTSNGVVHAVDQVIAASGS